MKRRITGSDQCIQSRSDRCPGSSAAMEFAAQERPPRGRAASAPAGATFFAVFAALQTPVDETLANPCAAGLGDCCIGTADATSSVPSGSRTVIAI